MKKLLYCVLMTLALSSCVNSQSNQIAKDAETQLPQTMRTYARFPESVKIENERVVYKNDSLCVIHYRFTANNGIGRPITNYKQYIYYAKNGIKYEAFSNIDNGDSAYINQQTYDKIKHNTFYENASYEEGLMYRIILALNDYGHIIGDAGSTIMLPNAFGTGKWHLCVAKDDFGDETGQRYIRLDGKGTFNSSISSNNPLTVSLYIDKNEQYMRIYKYDHHSEEKYLWIGKAKIKDSKGNVYDYIRAINHEGGKLQFDKGEFNNTIWVPALKSEEKLSCNISFFDAPESYTWRFDFDGYNNAIKYLK